METPQSSSITDINSSQSSKENHRAVPFITFDNQTKKFVISSEARAIISKPEYKKVGMISLVGKYRTGKSFLLNRVLINNKKTSKGFDVGPTIKPCTKGIWLWSTPLIISNNHSSEPFPAFLIDTEGLGAYDEEVNHDSKIFLIAILISSLFIYNSFGTIDESSINNLSLILNLSKSIKLHNTKSAHNEEEEMAKYFPSLLWLLRDFILKLEDSEGNVITAKQYLENALMNQKGSTDAIEEKNTVRKLIKTYFPERDCFPMVRPVENENDLQNLQSLPDERIRSEFLSQAEVLRNKVMKKTKPKNFNGKILSGEMLLELVESVITSINEGVIPVIENSWKYVMSNECLKSMGVIVNEYKERIRRHRSENIDKNDFFAELDNFNVKLVNELVKGFLEENAKKFDDINEYVMKLKASLNQEFKKFHEENASLLKEKYQNELAKEIGMITNDKEKMTNVNYLSFISDLIQIRDKIDALIPQFTMKSQISFDMIISAIKKYIESSFVRAKKESDNKINSLQNENEIIQSKFENLKNEYAKEKQEYQQNFNAINEKLIEYKLREKSYEEKIKNFENEKKGLKESNERTIQALNKENETKIENYTMDINKLKNELKTKEEELLVIKLNNEKVLALNEQKNTFQQKEIEQWKERYNVQFKDLSEAKSEILNLTTENEKLKDEIKELKNKLILSSSNQTNSLRMSSEISSSSSNALLKAILSEQSEIKSMLLSLTSSMSTQQPPQKIITVQPASSSSTSLLSVNKKTQITISSTILKQDENGRPYLEYICEVSSNGNTWSVNKKFTQFALFNKALKNLFKDLILLPDSGSLFTNINDMTGNSFHENKLQQLDKYINDLSEIEAVANSVPFRSFFEIDEVHSNNNKKKNIQIAKKITVDKKIGNKSISPVPKSKNKKISVVKSNSHNDTEEK